MKKILLLCASTLFLTACTDKQQYEEAVLAEMQQEKDLKDYKIDPEYMTQCVVELTTKEMPGLFAFDPYRMTAYQNYTKMITMGTVENKQQRLEELRTLFGSPQELTKAHATYTTSVMDCMASIIAKSENKEEDKK
ncbi:MAG: hypothetical protein KAT04_02430 [Methylococcales bacterium]|nr:hypothetical protein [Methylococcales bacterium]